VLSGLMSQPGRNTAMQTDYPQHPFCPRTPPYPPRSPDVRMVTVAEFYLYQGVAIAGGAWTAIALGSILPAIAAPLLVGVCLFGNQRWQRHTELKRYVREYAEFSRQRQFLWLMPLEGK